MQQFSSNPEVIKSSERLLESITSHAEKVISSLTEQLIASMKANIEIIALEAINLI